MRKTSAISVIGLMATLLLGSMSTASATGSAPTTKVPLSQKYVTKKMSLVRFDADTARKNGYSILTLSDGTQVSILTSKLQAIGAKPSDAAVKKAAAAVIPANAPSSTVQPNNYVYGDCGDSYYFVTVWGDGSWSSLTGYDVSAAVSSFDWWTGLSDPSGSEIESIEYGFGPTGPSWEGQDGDGAGFLTKYGTYHGYVSSGHAILVNGSYCVSGDPGDVSTR